MTNSVKKEQWENFHTLKDFMRWGASEFSRNNLTFGHGMSTALDESVYLVLHSLHLPIDTPSVYWDARLSDGEKARIVDLFERRITSREPSAYLTHESWFANLPFYVDQRVLIPRSPIAELIEKQFAPWIDSDDTHRILDLCTGSGCIGIACQYAFPHSQVDLADLSQDALDVAEINLRNHDLTHRITLLQGDGLQACDQNAPYDLIVCNPPYVDIEDMQALCQEFKHEPQMALESGDNGLDFTNKLLQQAADYLTEEGVLVCEVGNSQYALQEIHGDVPFQWIEFERGGDGVFILTKEQLIKYF